MVSGSYLSGVRTVTPKGSPQYNPFAEALLGAFKEECVYQSDWKAYEEAVRGIEAWFHKYRTAASRMPLAGWPPWSTEPNSSEGL